VHVRETHPAGFKILELSSHLLHFGPIAPGLQTQRPVICSQSSRTEPNREQPQAETILYLLNSTLFYLKTTYACNLDGLMIFLVIPNTRAHIGHTSLHQLLICISIFYRHTPLILNLK